MRCFVPKLAGFHDAIAAELAAAGALDQLQRLMQLHPYSLMPSMLDVLSALPETMPVADFRQLLRVRPWYALCSGFMLECSLLRH